ncbi:MAG TPA: transcription termination/antitermination protein NusG [Lacipirellulaceae bacterium]
MGTETEPRDEVVTDEPNRFADDATVEFAESADVDRPRADPKNTSREDGMHATSPAGGAVDHELALRETVVDVAAVSTEEAEQESPEDNSEQPLVAEEQIESKSGPVYVAPPEDDDLRMDWYILKVQSNRERSIAEAVERKIKVEGLDRYFDQVIVPTEKVTEFKGGKKKVVERKLYPGYIVVHMHINDDTWFAVRETSGVGDFTGAGGKPTPMLPHEVSKIIQTETEETQEAPKLDIKFAKGDKVKVKEGNFESFEGEVGSIDEASGRVTVMINIFGRSTPVELEYWQIEAM